VSYAFFWIPARRATDAQEELNRFLGGHRVIAVDRQFVSDGERSGWAVAVDYVGGTPPAPGTKSRIDYREVLDAETFAVFAALRARRKEPVFSPSLAEMGVR
jgi:hypothetical protein